jgi:nucleotide-binding universal stress UspA family protein
MAWLRRASRHRAPSAATGFRRVVVPVARNRECERAVDIACKLAAERRSRLAFVAVVEVPVELPLDAQMPDEDADARFLLDTARALAESYGIRATVHAVRGREAGEEIVRWASDLQAEAIVVGVPRRDTYRSRRHPAVGRTVETVLLGAPCRVVVVSAAAEAPETARLSVGDPVLVPTVGRPRPA